MRVRDPAGEAEEPFNLVPLTDMVFNLLIFFMAATTFAQVEKEVSIRLPHASNFTSLSAPPKQLVVNVDKDGAAIVNHKTIDESALMELVRAMAKANKQSSVIVRADERGYVKGLARVMNDCQIAGAQKVQLVYLGGGGPAK